MLWMLSKEPEKRPTAEEALSHLWFQDDSQLISNLLVLIPSQDISPSVSKRVSYYDLLKQAKLSKSNSSNLNVVGMTCDHRHSLQKIQYKSKLIQISRLQTKNDIKPNEGKSIDVKHDFHKHALKQTPNLLRKLGLTEAKIHQKEQERELIIKDKGPVSPMMLKGKDEIIYCEEEFGEEESFQNK